MKEDAKQKQHYKKFFSKFIKQVESYLHNEVLLLKLKAVEGLALGVGQLVAAIFLMVSALLLLFFGGITLAIYFFEIFNNWFKAFGLVTGLFGLLFVTVLLAYNTIKKLAANMVVKNTLSYENSQH
jgi:hypothetical protein